MRINLKNREKIESELERVNGRARTHVASFYDISRAARDAESILQNYQIPKRLWRGARIEYAPWGPGKAYSRKGRMVITNRVWIERGARDWFVTSIKRNEEYADFPGIFKIGITDSAYDHAKRAMGETLRAITGKES